jgi:3-phenylpropionate/trans-cinnamate dioxygenase ferredoxin reductase subunit
MWTSDGLGVVSADPDEPYDRTKLSKDLLFEDATVSSIVVEGGRIRGCEWMSETTAQWLDVATSRVWTDAYGPIGFGRLVIASGAAPRRLPGGSATGVLHLYTLSDALALRSRLGELTRATVVVSRSG